MVAEQERRQHVCLFSIPEKNFWFVVHGVLCMSSLCRPGCFLIVIMLMCRGTFHHMSQFSCVVSGGPCLAKTSRVVPEVTISQLFLLKNIWVNVLPRTDSGALLLIVFLWQLNEITTFLFLIRDLLDYTRLMNKLQNQITKKNTKHIQIWLLLSQKRKQKW